MKQPKEITLPANNWHPRPYQEAFWAYMQSHPVGARAILCHHRRAGKDHTAINWAACASQMRVGLYIHIFPYANQGRRVIWNGIDGSGKKFMDAFPGELVESRSDLEMRLKLKNGSIYQVLGADDPDKLVGINCVGAIFSEFSLMDPKALELVMPILNENGGWAIFPSTPRGENHFYELCENARKNPERWFLSIETIETTGAVNPKVIQEERERGVEEALIQQEYYCSFKAPLQGSYYDKQMSRMEEEKRITAVPHDPAMPVNTAWDLGVNDSCTIWFYQMSKNGLVQVIDYYEATGEGFGHYARILDEKARKGDWTYGTHYAPHDIMQRDVGTAKTRIDTAREVGLRFQPVQKSDIDDGIEAVRQLLPRTWIDAKNCRRGINCLKGYRKEWDERLKVYRNKPRHDEYSHGADAFRTLAMAEIKRKEKQKTREEDKRRAISDYDISKW
jgi:hypothetical protein